MTIINANTSSMKVLKACKENGKLGEEIREGGRGGAESQGEGERKTEGRKGRGVGTREGKKKSHAKCNEFQYLYLFCSENICCFRIPVHWNRVTEGAKSKISNKVKVNDRRGAIQEFKTHVA